MHAKRTFRQNQWPLRTLANAPSAEHSKSALIVQKLEAVQKLSRFESVGRRPHGAGVRGGGRVEGHSSRPLQPTHRSLPFSAILSPHSDPGQSGYLQSTIYSLSKLAKVLGHVVAGCVHTFAADSSQLERSKLVGQSGMRPRAPKARINPLLLLGYSRHSIGPP